MIHNILCLGDSLTVGSSSGESTFRSYRGPLIARLRSIGHQVTMVGPVDALPNGYTGVAGDGRCAGYGGATIGPDSTGNNIDSRIASIAGNAPNPSIIILLAGANDLYGPSAGTLAATAHTRYAALIVKVKAQWPSAKLIVGVTPDATYASETARQQSRALWEVCKAAWLADKARVRAIDLRDRIASADYYDGLHWTATGAAKVARLLTIEVQSVADPRTGTVIYFSGNKAGSTQDGTLANPYNDFNALRSRIISINAAGSFTTLRQAPNSIWSGRIPEELVAVNFASLTGDPTSWIEGGVRTTTWAAIGGAPSGSQLWRSTAVPYTDNAYTSNGNVRIDDQIIASVHWDRAGGLGPTVARMATFGRASCVDLTNMSTLLLLPSGVNPNSAQTFESYWAGFMNNWNTRTTPRYGIVFQDLRYRSFSAYPCLVMSCVGVVFRRFSFYHIGGRFRSTAQFWEGNGCDIGGGCRNGLVEDIYGEAVEDSLMSTQPIDSLGDQTDVCVRRLRGKHVGLAMAESVSQIINGQNLSGAIIDDVQCEFFANFRPGCLRPDSANGAKSLVAMNQQWYGGAAPTSLIGEQTLRNIVARDARAIWISMRSTTRAKINIENCAAYIDTPGASVPHGILVGTDIGAGADVFIRGCVTKGVTDGVYVSPGDTAMVVDVENHTAVDGTNAFNGVGLGSKQLKLRNVLADNLTGAVATSWSSGVVSSGGNRISRVGSAGFTLSGSDTNAGGAAPTFAAGGLGALTDTSPGVATGVVPTTRRVDRNGKPFPMAAPFISGGYGVGTTVSLPPSISIVEAPSMAVQRDSVVGVRVVDQDGAVVTGATLSWVGEAAGVIVNATTDGSDRVPIRINAQPGTYTLLAAKGALTDTAVITVSAKVTGATASNRIPDSDNPEKATWLRRDVEVTYAPTVVMHDGVPGVSRVRALAAGHSMYTEPVPITDGSPCHFVAFLKRDPSSGTPWAILKCDDSAFTKTVWVFVNTETGQLGTVFPVNCTCDAPRVERWPGDCWRVIVENVQFGAGTASAVGEIMSTSANAEYTAPAGGSLFFGGMAIGVGATAPHHVANKAVYTLTAQGPSTAVTTGQQVQLDAQVTGTSDADLTYTWSIVSGPAAITAAGQLTASGTAGSVVARVAANGDPRMVADVDITVQAQSGGGGGGGGEPSAERFVEILARQDLAGTSGWTVAVYAKVQGKVFPLGQVFSEVTGQAFQSATVTRNGTVHARMLVPVPSGTGAAVGDVVQAIIRGSIAGQARGSHMIDDAVVVGPDQPADPFAISVDGNALKINNVTGVKLIGPAQYVVKPYTAATDTGSPWYVDDAYLDSLQSWAGLESTIDRVRSELGVEATGLWRIPLSFLNPDIPVQWAQLQTFLDRLQARGVFALLCPYGDFASRGQSVVGGAFVHGDPTTDGTAVSAVTAEHKAFYTKLRPLFSRKNVLVELMNEPRQMTWNQWRDQAIELCADLRSKGYTRPIFVGTKDWSWAADVAAMQAVASADSQVVFCGHRYSESGGYTAPAGQPANTTDPYMVGWEEAKRKFCCAITEVGFFNGVFAWGAWTDYQAARVKGSTLLAPMYEWLAKILLQESDVPVVIPWMVMDADFGNALLGDNWYEVTTGVTQATTNRWGEMVKGWAAKFRSKKFERLFSAEYASQPAGLDTTYRLKRLHAFNPIPFFWPAVPGETNEQQIIRLNGQPALTASQAAAGVSAVVAAEASRYGGVAPMWMLDFEFWAQHGQMDPDGGGDYTAIDPTGPPFPTTAARILKFAQSAAAVKAAMVAAGRGDIQLGYYGVLPIDAWSLTLSAPGTEAFIRQTAAMLIPEYDQLIASVDYLSSTAYLPSDWQSQPGYLTHIVNQWKAAKNRAPGKPLYLFVCPQYTQGPNAWTYMGGDVMRMLMRLVKEHADGAIWWGGATLSGAQPHSNTSAEWLAFLG